MLAEIRSPVTGIYEITGSGAWKAGLGWTGLGRARVHAATALEEEGGQRQTLFRWDAGERDRPLVQA